MSNITIHTLDLNYQNVPQVTAVYLVIGPQGPVLVETGPGSTLNTLLKGLSEHGYAPGDIRHVLVTHIHLDHAGAAGWWAQQGAQIFVHHIGASHLIDPSRLISSATRIYGDRMQPLWGEILAAPAENVTNVHDNDVINICGLTFIALDTPGHAIHHHTYQLNDIAFTGDAAGMCLPAKSMADLPAPPPEFNLEIWERTVDRLLAQNYKMIYPTHFGPRENVPDHLQAFKGLLRAAAEFVHERMQADMERDELVKQYETWQQGRAKESGLSKNDLLRLEVVNPAYMSVDGIMRYWHKRQNR